MIKNATRFLPLSVVGATIVTLAWTIPAQALTVFGNNIFPATNTNNTSINESNTDPNNNNLPAPQRKAVGFTTDSRGWALNFVRLGLAGLDSADSPIIQIRADDAGNPGTQVIATLNTFNPAPSNGADNVFTVSPTGGPVTLAANTTYWLYVGGGAYTWFENGQRDPDTGLTIPGSSGDLPTARSSSGWQFVDYKFTGNGSLNWGAGNGIRNAFNIDATEITPVPFAFSPIPGLIVSGIIGGVKRARSKSRQANSTAEA